MEGYFSGSTCEGPLDDPNTYKKIEKLTNQYVKENSTWNDQNGSKGLRN